MSVTLRPITPDDVPALYEHHLDEEANQLAAVRPRSRDAFTAFYDQIFASTDVTARAIEVDGSLAGSISVFLDEGRPSIGYWIDRPFWRRGVATRAIGLLLKEVPARPIHARVAVDNIGSIRALERNGFQLLRHEPVPEEGRYLACTEAKLILR